MIIEPNEPAYPSQLMDAQGLPCQCLNYGMTIRAEISSRIMASLSSKDVSASWELLASASVRAADALIAELNKPVAPAERED